MKTVEKPGKIMKTTVKKWKVHENRGRILMETLIGRSWLARENNGKSGGNGENHWENHRTK